MSNAQNKAKEKETTDNPKNELKNPRDLEEKIVYIAETLQNPQAANNLLDDEPNEGWCMMLLKPM